MDNWSRYAPWAVVAVCALYLGGAAAPVRDGDDEMHIQELAALPVVSHGRVKPLDTYARTQMQIVSSRTSYDDAAGNSQPAVRWLLDNMAVGLGRIVELTAFVRIDSAPMRDFLGLQPSIGNRYAIADLQESAPKLQALAKRLEKGAQTNPTELDNALLDLKEQLERNADLLARMDKQAAKRAIDKAPVFRIENDQVRAMLDLPNRKGLRYGREEIAKARGYKGVVELAQRTHETDAKHRDLVGIKAMEFVRHAEVIQDAQMLGGFSKARLKQADQLSRALLLVPPAPGGSEHDWRLLGESLLVEARVGEPDADVANLEGILKAYAVNDVAGFNSEVARYRASIDARMPHEASLCRLEVWFNNFSPFYDCTALYVLVFLLTCLSWLCWPQALLRSAFWLAVLTVAVHGAALVARMYLQGRPPVTNLYSSAVFIGWGGVLLCIGLETLFRNGFSLVVASWMGFGTLVIAHHLGGSGDTMEMMQAVLDTNFWLATHVTCVTFGYTATFVAGMFGIVYILVGVFTPALNKPTAKTLAQIIYGIVCFATLLSFVGTVLGGIWADQSWGRFWGWDPKENGALLIVIWNALILHARWGGMVKERGMAVLAVAGNMVTAWSWFGTNQLGVGLHAYGFNNTLATGCTVAWGVHLGVIGLGLVPPRHWRSMRDAVEPRPMLAADALAPAPVQAPIVPPTGVTPPAAQKGQGKDGIRKRRRR